MDRFPDMLTSVAHLFSAMVQGMTLDRSRVVKHGCCQICICIEFI